MRYLPLQSWKINTVIILIGVNDFVQRLAQDTAYDPGMLERDDATGKMLAETFYNIEDTSQPFYKRTATWRLLKRTKRQFSSRNIVQDESGKLYILWRKHRQQASEVRDTLPDLASAIGEYSRNVNTIIDLGEEMSIRFIFMTQPTMWRPNLPRELSDLLWFGGIGHYQHEMGKPYYSVEALAKGIDLYNETLLRICRERGIECIDLASVLPRDTSVFYDDVHFNENGARAIVQILSTYLLERPPFR
jgi:hypothetical protein